jgi:hypothetical protein
MRRQIIYRFKTTIAPRARGQTKKAVSFIAYGFYFMGF